MFSVLIENGLVAGQELMRVNDVEIQFGKKQKGWNCGVASLFEMEFETLQGNSVFRLKKR